MKLVEIYDFNDSYLNKRGPKSVAAAAREMIKRPDHEPVGSGASAYVGRSTSPSEMDRVERVGPKKDPTAVYLAAISKDPSAYDNPYLPRVLQKPRTSGNVQAVQMERLYPFDTPKIAGNVPLMLSLWKYWFSEPIPPSLQLCDADSPDDFAKTFAEFVAFAIDRAIDHGAVDEIRDPALVKAIQFIRRLMAKGAGYTADVHYANIMWRITGTMPQLVITDPLTGFLHADEM